MSGALGLVGGIPGLVMLGAGAWYAMYQSQEQARKSAQEYASQIDQIREKPHPCHFLRLITTEN